MPVTSSNPTSDFFFLPIFSHSVHEMKKVSIILLHEFYTASFSHNKCTLSFYKKYGKKSAESYVSLKGNDKAISILQNVIKVMVVLKKGRLSNVARFDASFILFSFYFRCANKRTKPNKLKIHQ